jgi:uncharacterized membrane protein
LVPLAILGEGAVRIALGLIFVLFLPGYTLIAALFPKQDSLDAVQRIALSFGLSIAVVPLIGFIMNYTPWGISSNSVLISLLIFIVAAAGVAWFRRRRLPPEQRFVVRFSFSWLRFWRFPNRWDRILSGVLIVVILAAIGMLVFVAISPTEEEKFTEFYILDSEGKAENYPNVLVSGEEAQVTIGIVNHEQEATDYIIKIFVAEQQVKEVKIMTLAHEESWEQVVSFTSAVVGEEQKVEFMLYIGGSNEAGLVLDLWIDVVGAE